MQAVRGSYCGRPRRSIRLLCLSYLIGSIFLTLVGHAAPVVFAAGAVWYVNPTGSDSNSCQTPTTPCKTINGAFSKAISSGDTVSIAAGTYTENIIIPPGLTSVTLLGAGAALTILDGNNAGSVVMASSGTALSVSGMTIQHGKAAAGGGISATTVTISNSIFTNNSASFAGGGIVALGTALVSNSTFTNNVAAQFGGGIGAHILTISNSTVSNNNSPFGGGISADSVVVRASTIDTNIGSNGAGIDGTIVQVSNSTISNNTATTSPASANLTPSSAGGGIFIAPGVVSPPQLLLANDTISGNIAAGVSAQGGGIFVTNGIPATLRNSIVAGNSAAIGPDCSGALISNGFNILGNNSGCTGLTNGTQGDQVGTSLSPIVPLLGPLQDNGGPTKTMALLPGSVAINAGNPSGCNSADGPLTTDQRGFARPDISSGLCDIGAFELQACTILATVLGPTTTGLAARLGVANIPSLKNPLSYITFRAGNSSFVARMPISGTFGCVSQGTAHATVLLSGTVDSARGPAFTSGDAVTVFIQLKNINGVVQVDVKDVSKGSTFTFVGPLNFGSAILIK